MFYGPPMGCALCKVRSEYDYDFLNITTILLQTFSWNVYACVYTAETAVGMPMHCMEQGWKNTRMFTVTQNWYVRGVLLNDFRTTVENSSGHVFYVELHSVSRRVLRAVSHFTDNIKNDVIKNIFYIRCRDSGPIFYLEWWKLDNFLFSHFDFNYYLIIFSLAFSTLYLLQR